jgi:hypothetical protein
MNSESPKTMQQLKALSQRQGSKTAFSRVWAMPNSETFSIIPIRAFVNKYLENSEISIDPFARNSQLCTYTNDLNPDTKAQYHLDALTFLNNLKNENIKADLIIFDPPYSPRQISECYSNVGKKVGTKETQSAVLYKNVRNALNPLLNTGGIVLSFGWNSVGMGRKRGYELIEIMMVCHGGAHNDTICIAERKLHEKLTLF